MKPAPIAEMKELDLAMVLPNQQAVEELQAETCEVGAVPCECEDDVPLPPGSPPRASTKSRQSKVHT